MYSVNHEGGCLSELALDEWVARELSEPESARVAAHVASCAQCRARHRALEAERADFLAKAPSFAEHAAVVCRSQQRVIPLRQRILLAATSAATLAATALLVLWSGGKFEETRSKGPAHLSWFVKRGEHVHRGRADEPLYPGDALRFLYSSGEPRYLAIVNVDARAASVYFPSGARAALVRAGNDVALDFSVELDGQLGRERVYALFCETAVEIEPLRAALSETARLPETSGCQAEVIVLQKVAPR
jgi:hypothetical protein